ncbi:SCO family protein [Arcticibacterium luteifluviistationis]|uniref:SCO family protein n=1 Tax=Arcticibacterium luteifluviistationis TaxID=1784714 RepID=A0A2Z4GG86_9BACT|nr:SCO family protein [Arcticibacterium luteifluviistationis]AWW00271.1 SCO family protein [Arcticibacterium luteifluviistationis]
MYRIAFLLVSSIWLLGCHEKETEGLALPYYNDPTFTPVFVNETSDVSAEITHTIDDFQFLNQDSVLIDQSILQDKIHVANFIFTSCGIICPTMTEHMKMVSDEFKDIVLLSYSVTPWIDTPSVLKAYKKSHEIENINWQFLTGSKADIYDLARKSYYAEEDIGFSKDSTEFLHTEHFLLVDKSKRIRGIYNGTLAFEMEQLTEDIKTLQLETSAK